MGVSNSSNYTTTRDDIIKRALRIIGALGTGETPDTAAVTEAAQALNDIVKEWDSDGNFVFFRGGASLDFPAYGTNYWSLGIGGTSLTTYQVHKINDVQIQWGTGTSMVRVPLTGLSRADWSNTIASPLVEGQPVNYLFVPSVPLGALPVAYIYVWPIPSTEFLARTSPKLVFTFQAGLMDFDASSDNPPVPSYLINALVWNLAEQLAFEYGVPIADRAQITKKAQLHKALALSYDQEEGSLFLRPEPNWSE